MPVVAEREALANTQKPRTFPQKLSEVTYTGSLPVTDQFRSLPMASAPTTSATRIPLFDMLAHIEQVGVPVYGRE